MRLAQNNSVRAHMVLLSILVASMLLFLGLESLHGATSYNAGRELDQAELQGADRLCRFGVNVLGGVETFDTESLRMGWYVDYQASASPPAIGAEYVPIIRLQQTGPLSYTYSPSGGQLQAAITSNPGVAWLIGNEPDRRTYQDDIEPQVYALAYHELYHLIKTADPSARIFAGTIVQPTAVRLQYLDMVLDSYQTTYGQHMPVDGWSIHNFILNEADDTRCDQVPVQIGCWGAGIPPGIDLLIGEVVSIDQSDSMSHFVDRIVRFRQWMADRGYRGLPVYLTEYGVLMPPDFGFDSARVNSFMDVTFDHMLAATDTLLGDPNDAFRLVQKWSWWSSSHVQTNGWLFDPATKQLTVVGTNYAAYTSNISNVIDLYPVSVSAIPPAPFSQGENVTFTLKAKLANSGNLVQPSGTAVVRVYEGDPGAGGVQIGGDYSVSLSGCGETDSVEIVWADVAPGAHQVYVSVDDDGNIPESDEQNNILVQTVLVATSESYLPVVLR